MKKLVFAQKCDALRHLLASSAKQSLGAVQGSKRQFYEEFLTSRGRFDGFRRSNQLSLPIIIPRVIIFMILYLTDSLLL